MKDVRRGRTLAGELVRGEVVKVPALNKTLASCFGCATSHSGGAACELMLVFVPVLSSCWSESALRWRGCERLVDIGDGERDTFGDGEREVAGEAVRENVSARRERFHCSHSSNLVSLASLCDRRTDSISGDR